MRQLNDHNDIINPAYDFCIKLKQIPSIAKKADAMIDMLDRHKVGKNNQVFWVCPLIEESKKVDHQSSIERYKHLKKFFNNNVGLLHGSLSDIEMNKLYNHPKVKAMVSLTHGEGYGRPLQEATMVGLPVIASGWSGQMDFLSQTDSILLGGEMVQVAISQIW